MILPPKSRGFWHEKSCVSKDEGTARERRLWSALESRARQAPRAKKVGCTPQGQGWVQPAILTRDTEPKRVAQGGLSRDLGSMTRITSGRLGFLGHDKNPPPALRGLSDTSGIGPRRGIAQCD